MVVGSTENTTEAHALDEVRTPEGTAAAPHYQDKQSSCEPAQTKRPSPLTDEIDDIAIVCDRFIGLTNED